MSGREIEIRPALEGDVPALEEISSFNWEGNDYLASVARSWIAEGGLSVGVSEGRVVGCGKLTLFPSGVAWLEGLRVHPGFKGRGFGRAISESILGEALRMKTEGSVQHIEFATYFRNVESIGMALGQGFEIVERFHELSCEKPGGSRCASRIEFPTDALAGYREHLPCGWRLQHNTPEGILWVASHSEAFSSGQASFYRKTGSNEFSLLDGGFEEPGRAAEAILSVVRPDIGAGEAEVILPDDARIIAAFREAGYEYWEEPGEANLLVLRHGGQ